MTLLSVHDGEIQSMDADIDKGDTFRVGKVVSLSPMFHWTDQKIRVPIPSTAPER